MLQKSVNHFYRGITIENNPLKMKKTRLYNSVLIADKCLKGSVVNPCNMEGGGGTIMYIAHFLG